MRTIGWTLTPGKPNERYTPEGVVLRNGPRGRPTAPWSLAPLCLHSPGGPCGAAASPPPHRHGPEGGWPSALGRSPALGGLWELLGALWLSADSGHGWTPQRAPAALRGPRGLAEGSPPGSAVRGKPTAGGSAVSSALTCGNVKIKKAH